MKPATPTNKTLIVPLLYPFFVSVDLCLFCSEKFGVCLDENKKSLDQKPEHVDIG